MSATVLFIGGWKADQPGVAAWTASATKLKPQATFVGFPYPAGASWDGDEALAVFKKAKDFARAVKIIEDSKSDLIYLVGHSSGCAITNAIDDHFKDHTKIVLVTLDGYAPSAAQLKRPSTQVWSAACDQARSLNFHRLKDAVGTRLQVFQATNCHHKWALHFSLVNLSASDTLAGGMDHVTDGYAECQANLLWM